MQALDHTHFQSSFEDWIALQTQDLDELQAALSANPHPNNEALRRLVEKNINHYEVYAERRAVMVDYDAPCFLHPNWITSYQKAFMWIGEFRPTLFIRLIFSAWSTYSDKHGKLAGPRDTKKGNLAKMSDEQFLKINTMRCHNITQEDKLSCRLATIQEDIADMRMGQEVGEINEEVISTIEAQNSALADIVKEADKLRVNSLKSLMEILTPVQGVELLVSTKKLHLSMHKWGIRVDHT